MKIHFFDISLWLIIIPVIESTEGADAVHRAEYVNVITDCVGGANELSKEEIFLVAADGTQMQVTHNHWMERAPIISSDGLLLCFLRRRENPLTGKVGWDSDAELWLMHLGTRNEERIGKSLRDLSSGSWHPCKRRIAFIATDDSNQRNLYEYSVSSHLSKVLSINALTWPAWSPCGRYIAFYNKDNKVAVYSCDLGHARVISDDVGNCWSLYWDANCVLGFKSAGKEAMLFRFSNGLDRGEGEGHIEFGAVLDQSRFGWADDLGRKIPK